MEGLDDLEDLLNQNGCISQSLPVTGMCTSSSSFFSLELIGITVMIGELRFAISLLITSTGRFPLCTEVP